MLSLALACQGSIFKLGYMEQVQVVVLCPSPSCAVWSGHEVGAA